MPYVKVGTPSIWPSRRYLMVPTTRWVRPSIGSPRVSRAPIRQGAEVRRHIPSGVTSSAVPTLGAGTSPHTSTFVILIILRVSRRLLYLDVPRSWKATFDSGLKVNVAIAAVKDASQR